MNYSFDQLEQLHQEYNEKPYFILDKKMLNYNLNEWKAGEKKLHLAYSLKANYAKPILECFGLSCSYLEVASWFEFQLARQYIDEKNIIVNGPIYSKNDLSNIVKSGGVLIVDSLEQLKILTLLDLQVPNFRLGVRIRMSDFPTSRFGILEEEIKEFKNLFPSNATLEMIHCHYCDGFRSVESFGKRILALEIIRKREFPEVHNLNIGGGFYSEMPAFLAHQFDEHIPKISHYVDIIQKHVPDQIHLITEIGAALVANTVDYCCKVVDVKKVSGKLVIVTNGSKWDIKPNGSSKNLPVSIYSASNNVKQGNLEIVGYTCMENDVLYRGQSHIPSIGDYLVFKNCGAYGQSLSPDFIQEKKDIYELPLI